VFNHLRKTRNDDVLFKIKLILKTKRRTETVVEFILQFIGKNMRLYHRGFREEDFYRCLVVPRFDVTDAAIFPDQFGNCIFDMKQFQAWIFFRRIRQQFHNIDTQ
jgi:hypothetical protein